MAIALGAVAAGLASLAMYEQMPEVDEEGVESPYSDAMKGDSAALAGSTFVAPFGDPRVGQSTAGARIARHEFLVDQNGGDDAYYRGMLDSNVRSTVNQLRTADGRSLPGLKPMQRAGVWAQQLAHDRRYQRSLAPVSITGDSGSNSSRVRPVFLSYLSVPGALEQTPYTTKAELDSTNNVKHDTTGTVDTNRTLGFRDPYNIGSPFTPFNRTRGAPTSVLPDSQQLDPLSEREVSNLLPRAGTAIVRRGGLRKGAKQVRIVA